MQDPLRTFVGREKYKRPLWATSSLEKPTVVRFNLHTLSSFFHSILQLQTCIQAYLLCFPNV
jgi:hypothetical protein